MSMVCDSYPRGAKANSTKGWRGPGLSLGAAIESVLLDVGQRTSIDLLVGCSDRLLKMGEKNPLFNKNSHTII